MFYVKHVSCFNHTGILHRAIITFSTSGFRFWKNDVFNAVDKIQTTLHEVYGDEVKITEAVIR